MKRKSSFSQEIEERPQGYSMSDRLRPPAGVSPTPDMKNLSPNLLRLNVLATYRAFEGEVVSVETR